MPGVGPPNHQRLLTTLEQLLEIPTADLRVTLTHTADLVAAALRADKVDAFLYDQQRDSLAALGTSNQPLSAEQRRHGLDVLPVANGGRVVWVFKTRQTFVTGRLDQDAEELIGIKETLKVRSTIGVVLEVGGMVRGTMMIASQKPEFFTPDDVRFAESVAHWVGVVAHRAELGEKIARNAAEQGRRAGAEELVTILAHDLRNYISPLRIRLDILCRRAEREGRERDQRDLGVLLKGVERLGALISDILDVGRINQGIFQMNIQAADVVPLVEETAAVLTTPERPVQVKPSEGLVVVGDPARVRQCLENLLANAVQHSPQGAPVTVTMMRHKIDASEFVRIDVINDGPGIPSDFLPRIFDRFVTGEGSERGLGLGLYLAKQIAVMHGGDLQVESVLGRGARFSLTLPSFDGQAQ
jgi:two-component system OmpR family sensor kinase